MYGFKKLYKLKAELTSINSEEVYHKRMRWAQKQFYFINGFFMFYVK